MRTIRLFAFQHRNELQIGITYKFDFELNEFIKNMEGMRWSRTYSCFYLPYSVNNKKRIYTVLKKIGCIIDYSALKDLTNREGRNSGGREFKFKYAAAGDPERIPELFNWATL